jgi:RNA recognition motif-containing protein
MINIFVAKLSYGTTESTLRKEFEKHGPVESLKIITDKETRKSKGFGFVEMADRDGEVAIRELNGMELDGRKIVVKKADPKR